MRKCFFILSVLLFIVASNAQSRLDDEGRIMIHAYVPDTESWPQEAQKLLQSKLSQIITANGIEDDENCVRFVLTAKVNAITKDIVPGPPPCVSQNLEICLILGDIQADKVYSRSIVNAIGVGGSEEKSLIAAFKTINPNNKKIKDFILEGKQKVLDFYQTSCENIILEAKKQANLNHYEDALMLLTSIPDVCSDCYEQSYRLANTIYQDMINVRGAETLRQAQSAWAQNPTKEGAIETTRLLSQINHAASCQSEVSKLLKQVTDKMNEIDRREWNLELQRYRDSVEREKRQWNQQVREYNDGVQTRRMFIKACRDVAVAYVKNRPSVINRIINFNNVLSW